MRSLSPRPCFARNAVSDFRHAGQGLGHREVDASVVHVAESLDGVNIAIP